MTQQLPPRWAFERVEQERACFLEVEPNPANVDVIMANSTGWQAYHAFAAYIARVERPPAVLPLVHYDFSQETRREADAYVITMIATPRTRPLAPDED